MYAYVYMRVCACTCAVMDSRKRVRALLATHVHTNRLCPHHAAVALIPNCLNPIKRAPPPVMTQFVAGHTSFCCLAALCLCDNLSGRSMCHGRLRGGPCLMCVNAEC